MMGLIDLNVFTDEALVEFYKAGTMAALGIMYQRYFQKVYGECLTILKDRDSAYDLAQDSILKAFDKIALFHGTSRFSTWLYAVTHNECIQYLRKTRSKSRMPVEDITDMADVPADISERQHWEEIEYRLTALLEQLPVEEKQLLRMRYWQNATTEDLREAFHLATDSAVKMRLQRARQKLQRLYKGFYKQL